MRSLIYPSFFLCVRIHNINLQIFKVKNHSYVSHVPRMEINYFTSKMKNLEDQLLVHSLQKELILINENSFS